MLYVADGRERAAIDGYFEAVGEQGCARTALVAMDMWPAYIGSMQEHTDALIAFDKFHVALQVRCGWPVRGRSTITYDNKQYVYAAWRGLRRTRRRGCSTPRTVCSHSGWERAEAARQLGREFAVSRRQAYHPVSTVRAIRGYADAADSLSARSALRRDGAAGHLASETWVNEGERKPRATLRQVHSDYMNCTVSPLSGMMKSIGEEINPKCLYDLKRMYGGIRYLFLANASCRSM